MIYKGKRILKVRDFNISEDSPLYCKVEDLEHCIVEYRCPLCEIASWEIYVAFNSFHFKGIKNSELIVLKMKSGEDVIVLDKLDNITTIMENYLANKMLFRQQ